MAVNLHTTHYRFGVEELLEATHGWHAAEDANPAQGVIANDITFLLRFNVQETGGTAAGNTDQQFEYNLNGAGWVAISTTSAAVKAVASVAFTNGQDATQRLGGTGTFESSGDGCTEDGLSGGAQNDIVASGCSETECALQIVGAAVSGGDSIQFRITSPDFAVTNDVVPTLITQVEGVSVTPGTASLATSLFAPTVTVSDNKLVVPGAASLAMTRFAPTVTVSNNILVVPGSAALTTTRFAPSVAAPALVIPEVLSVVLAVYAPTVTASTGTVVVPGTASLTITRFAPTV